MRTAGIIRIIVGLIIAVLLTALLVSALAGRSFFDRLGWNTDGWNGLFRSSFWSGRYSSTAGDDATVVSESASVAAADVRKIEINWVAGSVELRIGDGDEITFSESARKTLTDAQKMRYSLTSGGVLEISFSQELNDIRNWFSSDAYSMPAKALVVTVPASLIGKLDAINIDSVSARLDVDGVYGDETDFGTVSGEIVCANLVCGELDLSSTSGEIICEGVVADSLDLENVSGASRAEGSFAEIDAQTVSGSIQIASTTAPGKISGDSVSGDMTILLPEGAGFTATLDTVSGELSCAFPGTFSDQRIVTGDGEGNYRFDSVSGDISIEQN